MNAPKRGAFPTPRAELAGAQPFVPDADPGEHRDDDDGGNSGGDTDGGDPVDPETDPS